MRWVLAQPGISGVLVGCRNGDQVKENCDVLNTEMSDELFRKISLMGDDAQKLFGQFPNIFNYLP
jgi:aryl-alcohol dehydrogenase-like predicted oxidoreductase